ncbi:MAG: DUF3592 domain-containing protein [Micavibrio sp.]|nr:DUF3592 domain-containing protein [Micavibrio sp.]
MLDTLFSGFAAFNQVGALLAGLFCLAIGCGVLGNGIYWRMKAERVNATVTGVRQSGKFYYTVYSYMMPATGELVEATSDTGVDAVQAGMATGKEVSLMVFAADPHKVRVAGGWLYIIIGLFFLIPGSIFTHMALASYPLTPMTFVMLAAFAAYGAMKFKKILLPKGQRLTIAEWKAKNLAESRGGSRMTGQVLHVEDLAATPVFAAQAARNAANARKAAPILVLIGVGLILLGGYLAKKEQRLEDMGVRAPGRVVELRLNSSSDSNSYYPIVNFQDAGGNQHEFRARSGSNPPSYHVGEDVTVLYLADDAQASAIIDSGWMNWLPVILCGGIGLAMLIGGAALARQRDKAL